MKILIVSIFFPPQEVIASYRPLSWAKFWSNAGHDVDVLTVQKDEAFVSTNSESFRVHEIAPLNLFKWIKKSYRSSRSQAPSDPHQKSAPSFFKSIINHLKSKGIGTSTRMPDPFDLWISPAKKWLDQQNQKWDLVVSTYGPYSPHFVARYAKNTGKAKYWIADFRDLWTDSHIFPGVFPFKYFERFFEYDLLSQCDMATTVSQPLSNILKDKYSQLKVFTIENGFDPAHWDVVPDGPYFQDKKKRIVYTGTLYPGKRDPSPLFQALFELNEADPDLRDKLEVLFAGPQSDYLEGLISKYNVQRLVKYLGMLPRNTALHIQKDSDILLFLEYEAPGLDGILTGKLFEYMTSGTPIWAVGITNNVAAGKIIEASNTGKTFGQNSEVLKTEIKNLIGDKWTDKRPVDEVINQFNRENLANKMLSYFESTRNIHQ